MASGAFLLWRNILKYGKVICMELETQGRRFLEPQNHEQNTKVRKENNPDAANPQNSHIREQSSQLLLLQTVTHLSRSSRATAMW